MSENKRKVIEYLKKLEKWADNKIDHDLALHVRKVHASMESSVDEPPDLPVGRGVGDD